MSSHYKERSNLLNYTLPFNRRSICKSHWQTAFINATGLQGKNYSLHLINLEGKEIAFETGVLSSEYFTKNLPCNNLSAGVYLVLLETEKEWLVKKFIIE